MNPSSNRFSLSETPPEKSTGVDFAGGDETGIGVDMFAHRNLRDRLLDRYTRQIEIRMKTDGDRHRIRAEGSSR